MKCLNLTVLASLVASAAAIWPLPEKFTHGDDVLWLPSSVHFAYRVGGTEYYPFTEPLDSTGSSADKRGPDPKKPVPDVRQIVKQAVKRTENEIRESKFVPWKFHPRNGTFEPPADDQSGAIKKVVITEKPSKEAEGEARDYIHGDESYQIEISKEGSVDISSLSPIGTIRALQSLRQLFYTHSSKTGVYTPYAPLSISDKPRWSYRGLSFDISRNVFTPDDMKRTIDAMDLAKMSRLHLHATDSQAWPLDIPSIPELAQKAAYHPGAIWSASDLAGVQLYGLERGISVFVEIDLPGHTAIVAKAFPELVAAFEIDDWETYALQPPTGQIKLNSPAVDEFLDKIMKDLIPRVSPYTRYFHTGGDEFNLNTYWLDETVGSNDTDVIRPHLQRITDLVHGAIRKAGLIPVVWEDLALDWGIKFPESPGKGQEMLAQAWRNSTYVIESVEKGYQTIATPSDWWYIDCGFGNYLNPRQNSTIYVDPFPDWCEPLHNWRKMYVYNPLEGIPEEKHHLIEGGAPFTPTESIDAINMDTVLWPRTASIAEVLWTGPRNANQIEEASFRLGEWRERAVIDLGIRAGMAQMVYCLMKEGTCEW